MIIYKCDMCGAELDTLSAFEVEVTPIYGMHFSDTEGVVGTHHVCRYCLGHVLFSELKENLNRRKEIEDGQVGESMGSHER